MNGSLPFISVVVPARDRPGELAALFSAISEQSYPTSAFEVLVCDDGSEPPLAELVPVRNGAFSVRFLRRPQGGPAAARNRGIHEARGKIVAFTDDDCLPDPGWLEAIAEAFVNPETYAVHGPVHSTCPPIEFFVHSVHIGREQGVATANFAVLKENLLAVRGFDETFERPYFEDEDLARRLRAQFGEIAWSEAMLVQHPPRPVSWASAWRAAGYWRWLPYMRVKHPDAWVDALAGVQRRVVAKTSLLLLGATPLLGAPVVFSLAWAGLLAWQARRLKRALSLALAHGQHIALSAQGRFLLSEWVLDYRRWWAAWQGRGLEAKPREDIEMELGF
jgi:hypothetical protein